jgi:hypothetical protein
MDDLGLSLEKLQGGQEKDHMWNFGTNIHILGKKVKVGSAVLAGQKQ